MTQTVVRTDPVGPPSDTRRPLASRMASGPHLALAGLVIAALVLRYSLVDIQTGDYRNFLDPWYQHLRQASGLSGLADINSNYNTPYLVLLGLISKTPIPELVAIKSLSVAFDLLLAFFAYKIIALIKPRARWLPTFAAGAALFLPTVVMNSSAWAQCDSIYASLCLGSLYFLMKRQAWLACALFGLAFAFKLQAVFLLPALLGVLLINRLRIRALLAVPVVFLAALVPAWLSGRSLLTQLMTYPNQTSDTGGNAGGGAGGAAGAGGGGLGRATGGAGTGTRGGGGFQPGANSGPPSGASGTGGSGGFAGFGGGPGGGTTRGGFGGGVGTGHAYTDNAPTWYAWLPSDASSWWKYVGFGLAAVVAIVFAVILFRRRRQLSPAEILLVAAASTLIIPLLLPQMHERYFYLAEILTLLACFVGRGWIAAAACIQLATITTYLAYLNNTTYVPLGLAALVAMAGAVVAAVVLLRALRTPGSGTTASGGTESVPTDQRLEVQPD